jgi:hypothetical protein
MGAAEVEQFLSHLAAETLVSASTQNPCTEPAEVRPSRPCCSLSCRPVLWPGTGTDRALPGSPRHSPGRLTRPARQENHLRPP